MMRKVFILLFCVILFNSNFLFAQSSFRVVAYVPNWSNWPGIANTMQWSKITHVHIAFYNPSPTSSVLNGNAALTTFVTTAHANNVKVLASLGGATASGTAWATWTSAANRATFISNIVSFANTYNLDGIDLDLEGSSVTSSYEGFVVDLSTALVAENKLLAAAVAPWFGTYITPTALSKFDYVGLMSYDQTGSWSPCSPGPHSPFTLVQSDITYWRNKGLTDDRIVVGVPFYGYYFGSGAGSVTFASISAIATAVYRDVYQWGSATAVYYNGIPTIKYKTRYALDSDLGGMMFWELSQDASGANSLLSAMDEVIQGYATSVRPVVTISSPADASSSAEGTSIEITADVVATADVVKVDFYAGTVWIGDDMTAPYSVSWINPDQGTYALTARVIDVNGASDTSVATNLTISAGASSPYLGTAWAVPGTIQAENFDNGGAGVSYSEVTTTNQGGEYRPTPVDVQMTPDGGLGYAVGWTSAGEWLAYTINVADAANYSMVLRVATTNSNRTISISIDGTDLAGTLTVPSSGSWGCYQDLLVPSVALSSGQHIMKVNFITGGVNLNYTKFTVVTPILAARTSTLSAYLYPNPGSAPQVHVEDIDGQAVQLIVSDQSGRKLYEQVVVADGNDLALPELGLGKGMYIVQVVVGNRATSLAWFK